MSHYTAEHRDYFIRLFRNKTGMSLSEATNAAVAALAYLRRSSA